LRFSSVIEMFVAVVAFWHALLRAGVGSYFHS